LSSRHSGILSERKIKRGHWIVASFFQPGDVDQIAHFGAGKQRT
jgi:hypothetical protein